jgi:quinol monooxygenase YgiN
MRLVTGLPWQQQFSEIDPFIYAERMSEVRVIARAVAREGKREELRKVLAAMLAPTQAEPGCLVYDLYESDQRGRFYFYERWESQAALADHAASVHFRNLQGQLEGLLDGSLEVNILEQV